MRIPTVVLTAVLVFVTASGGGAQAPGSRRLSRTDLEDKIRGGWAGQMIGV